MPIKRVSFALLAIVALGLLVGAAHSPAAAQPPAAPMLAAPVLSGELVISDIDNEKYLPAVAFNSHHNEYLVVWQNKWPGNRDIYAWRVSNRGELISWFTVVTGAGGDGFDRAQPSVAYDPLNDRYLVVFIHDVLGDGSDWDIGGRFIPWYGPEPGLSEFPICQWNSSQWNPVVAYGRAQQEFMLTWTNTPASISSYISAARLGADGTLIDDFTVSSGTENRINPDIAYNLSRNEYLVTWDMLGSSHDIYGLRMTGSGSALGSEFAIAGWPADEEQPAVAACANADRYLVAWQSLVNPPIDYDAYARYVNGDGSLGGVYLVDGTTAPEVATAVACSSDGRQFLLAWQTMYAGGYYGVWGRFALPDETMEPSFMLVSPGATANRTVPAIAGGQSSFLVIWEHERDGTSYRDIHGRLVIPHISYLPLMRR